MDAGTLQYIKQHIPQPWFSDTKYMSNATGVGAAMQDFRAQGAVLILITEMSLQIPAGAAVLVIADQFGRVLFQGAQQVENSGDYTRKHIIQAGYIRITTNIAAVGFTIGFQYITWQASTIINGK